MSNRDEPAVQGENVRSHQSRQISFVRFQNATQRTVDVIWINYKGERVKYKTLEPNEFFDVNTYVAHPWEFRDSKTHENLVTMSHNIFYPRPWFEPYLPEIASGRLQANQIRPERVKVFITIPLYTLKDCAIHTIRKCLTKLEDASQLEIPRQLQRELLSQPGIST